MDKSTDEKCPVCGCECIIRTTSKCIKKICRCTHKAYDAVATPFKEYFKEDDILVCRSSVECGSDVLGGM